MSVPDEIVIPDKPAFRAAEVCELLKLQPYVLKSWENEFKDLGVAKTPGGPRVYRRVDVERAVRIRELMLRDGLTLAGVRRRLEQEAATSDAEAELIAEITSSASQAPARLAAVDRERVAHVRQGLRALLDTLSRPARHTPAGATAAGTPGPGAAESLSSPAGPSAAALQPDAVSARSGTIPDRGVTPPAHPAAPRELTVVSDEVPSLFDDEPAIAREPDASAKTGRRKRSPRASPLPAE